MSDPRTEDQSAQVEEPTTPQPAQPVEEPEQEEEMSSASANKLEVDMQAPSPFQEHWAGRGLLYTADEDGVFHNVSAVDVMDLIAIGSTVIGPSPAGTDMQSSKSEAADAAALRSPSPAPISPPSTPPAEEAAVSA